MARLLKPALLAASLLFAAPAQALDISAELDQRGIQGTITLLEQLSRNRTADEDFALGALQYLAAVELTVQAYWQLGDNDDLPLLPMPSLDAPPNHNAAPLEPATLSNLLTATVTQMEASRAALAAIPPDADFALEIDLSILWFDVDANGRRGPGEDARSIIGHRLLGYKRYSSQPEIPLPVVRFDTADAAWLMSYTHFTQALCEIVLAYDPTDAIARVIDARTAFAPLAETGRYVDTGLVADIAAIVDGALDQPPDAARLASAHANLVQTVAEGRRFWTLVAAETDDDREWLPNESQTSAIGDPLPSGTTARMQAIYDEAEAVLNGDVLIPHFRNETGLGVNLRRMLLEPRPIDLIGWFQGFAALPYLETGPVVSPQTRRAFSRMTYGTGYLLVFMD
ncbi:MAG: hypothetical protein ACRC6I_13090 [Paracoccaceae bacterium]